MGRTDFGPKTWLEVVRNTVGIEMCVPRDLTPELDFDAARVDALSTADRALGQLNGITRALLNPPDCSSVCVFDVQVLPGTISRHISGPRADRDTRRPLRTVPPP